ncbi:Arginase/deacetylase [Coprinopsis marcescibilis]|uniref:Arginase/deacetylase n=1 Tax=Coprinopsis marcescibilis TaxID=230819 RepID=A0A5C3L4M9_COPMA|nr:Arginase/deacetylase [Coprinopsis marcescibilis]
MTVKRPGVFLQNACLQHRYIRSQDLSNIVERPERLRAVNIGLSAAIAHLEGLLPPVNQPAPSSSTGGTGSASDATHDLVAALDRMKLEVPGAGAAISTKIPIVQSQAKVNILDNEAVKFVHGDIDGDIYLETLKKWARDSAEKVAQGESEIPQGYSQGDLYLCPESINAMEGALGTTCEAVDAVIRASREPFQGELESTNVHRAFVAVRPPGHHCGEDTPSGFCFVNNVAVAAAHAHLKHGIKRIAIFDIDLHHGNGTQSIVWQINEETYRQNLEQEAGAPPNEPGAQIYYGSIHDILSYPCEDGKPELVQAASVSLHQAHGQHIENVHLQTYTSEEHFWSELYAKKYSRLIKKAEDFLDATGGPGDDVMVFISCGMDACEHEYASMSRHNRKVPTGFYYQFARDACAFSDKYAKGRVVSVLEGGYSDRALTSASMAHLVGLTDLPAGAEIDKGWWGLENLVELEKATKKRRGGRPSLPANGSVRQWVERTLAIFAPLDLGAAGVLASFKNAPPPIKMTLRDRGKGKGGSVTPTPAGATASAATVPTPVASPKKGRQSRGGAQAEVPVKIEVTNETEGLDGPGAGDLGEVVAAPIPVSAPEQQKVRRVILKLGPSAS